MPIPEIFVSVAQVSVRAGEEIAKTDGVTEGVAKRETIADVETRRLHAPTNFDEGAPLNG